MTITDKGALSLYHGLDYLEAEIDRKLEEIQRLQKVFEETTSSAMVVASDRDRAARVNDVKGFFAHIFRFNNLKRQRQRLQIRLESLFEEFEALIERQKESAQRLIGDLYRQLPVNDVSDMQKLVDLDRMTACA